MEEDGFEQDIPDEVINDNLEVTGCLTASNWVIGAEWITPVANTPTSVTVTGINIGGTGEINYQVTASSEVPGLRVKEVSVSNTHKTTGNPSTFEIWIYRTDTTATLVNYILYREP